jgi:hypothetical protein
VGRQKYVLLPRENCRRTFGGSGNSNMCMVLYDSCRGSLLRGISRPPHGIGWNLPTYSVDFPIHLSDVGLYIDLLHRPRHYPQKKILPFNPGRYIAERG